MLYKCTNGGARASRFVHVVVSLSLNSQSRYNVNDRQTTRHQGTHIRLSQNYLPRERYSCKLFVIFATHLLQNKTQLKHVTETPRKIDVKLKHRTRSVHTGWSLSHITFIFIPTYYVFLLPHNTTYVIKNVTNNSQPHTHGTFVATNIRRVDPSFTR